MSAYLVIEGTPRDKEALGRYGSQAILANRGATHRNYVSRSVLSTEGHLRSKSLSCWRPRFNRASIRRCVSVHVSAL